ncbi:MAG: chromate resistance protein [Acidobacteriota bacterium]|nr:chromate resistance protein [Acidobacteriota bacterium]
MRKPLATTNSVTRARPLPGAGPRGWLLLVHQLPPTPSNLRVRTWRRLQELGAVAVKQSVYVLPDTAESREDFEWLKVEIEGAGGEAVVYSADHLDAAAGAALIDQFRQVRQQAYTALASELQRIQRAGASRQGPPGRRRDLARYRERFAAIERVDFFGSAGRDRVVTLLGNLEAAAPSAAKGKGPQPTRGPADAGQYDGRLWVTRPRPGVDRMASAWLIRRFIDSKARFGFITDVKSAGDALPFDMFGAGFGHEGDRCTFETLAARFAISDPAVARIAEIVHDLDLKDGKFGAPEAATLGITIDGLQLSSMDDSMLLDQGMTLFEALYRSFGQSIRPSRPRSVVTRKHKGSRPK